MKKRFKFLFGIIPILAGSILLGTCLNPIEFSPNFPNVNITGEITGEINITDVTSAVLMLTNRSRTVDVTHVSITQPEWTAPAGNPDAVAPSVSFAGKPKRLEKKAQYLPPSDKSYRVVIDYKYDALNNTPAGTGTQTISVPLPIPQQIVEYIIYRNKDGVIIVDKETVNPDPDDTGNPAIDTAPGEGSSPAEIPPEYRSRLAAFIVVNMTNSQAIGSVNFKKGEADYTMGGINIRDRQSIALSQGSWATMIHYTRNGVEKTIGPRNSIVVASTDIQSIREHYLYFYLNKLNDYAVSTTWPPSPNDVYEEDLLPTDGGYGRGMIEIINNSHAMAETVAIQDLRDLGKFAYTVYFDKFNPPAPVQYNKTGYVDVVGTAAFPIDAHGDYLIQITMGTKTGNAIVERKAYIKDQVVTIVITENDLNLNNLRGAKVTLVNNTNAWPVEIISLTVRNKVNSMQSSYYSASTWNPNGSIAKGRSAYQYVMSTTAMPITKGAEFEALVTMYANGVSATETINILQPELYSESPPDQNTRTITINDADVPQSIKEKGSTGAKVILENRVSSWPVEIIGLEVWNKSKPTESSYYNESTWQPGVSIGKNRSAAQTVLSSATMPITAGAQFQALIVISGSGKTESVLKDFTPAELYSNSAPDQNTRTLTLTDSDIPDSIKDAYAYTRGAKFTIVNSTNTSPVQIIGMTVRAKNDHNLFSYYSDSTWEPHTLIEKNKSAIQMVSSSPAMPIRPGVEFEAVLTLFANNKSAEVVKALIPAALYSDMEPDQNARNIMVIDTDVPATLRPTTPPVDNTIGAKVTLQNRITNWPVQVIGMTVRNKADNGKNSSYDGNSWTPPGQINSNGNAVQMVYASTDMPMTASDKFEAMVTLYYNGTMADVKKAFNPEELHSTNPDQNTRTITVTNNDVPQSIIDSFDNSRGAKVILENDVSTKWPVQIINMTVRNRADNSKKTDYDSATWDPRTVISNGRKAEQTVMTSAGMPIRAGGQFEAVITLLGNGKIGTVTKVFNPAELYSTLDPASNTRTITITDTDVPETLKPPVPTPEGEVQDNIANAGDGDTVIIDGVEWIKVRTDTKDSKLVLLMLKGVTGPSVRYDDNGRGAEYGSSNPPSIKGKVDAWYRDLRSPTLKKIAWKVNLGNSPNKTSPSGSLAGEANYTTVAFIPRLADIQNLRQEKIANGYKFWNSDIYQQYYCLFWRVDVVGIVLENGSGRDCTYPDSSLYMRPCIWVTTR